MSANSSNSGPNLVAYAPMEAHAFNFRHRAKVSEGQKRFSIIITILVGVAALVMLGPVQAAEGTLWFQGTVHGKAAQARVDYFTYEHTASGVEFNGQVRVGPRQYWFNAWGRVGQLYEGGRLIAYIELQISEQAMQIRLESGETFYFQRSR